MAADGYLDFVPELATTKTERWSVQNRRSGTQLGTVKWYSAWRQYCYFPSVQQVLSAGCMDSIAAHCREETELQRSGRRSGS